MSQLNTQQWSSGVIRLPFNDITEIVSVTQPSSGTIVAKRFGSPHSNFWGIRLKLTSVPVTLTNADEFGGVAICSLAANANHFIAAAAADVDVVASGGISLTTNVLDVAVGTAVASNVTMASTTMSNVCAKADFPALVAGAGSIQAYSTAALTTQAATTTLYMNFALTGGAVISSDGIVTVTAEVVLIGTSVLANVDT